MTTRARVLACLLFGLPACSSERKSEPANTDVGYWQHATVTVAYHPAFYKNGSSHPAEVVQAMNIERDADPYNGLYVILSIRSEKEVSSSAFRELRATKYAQRFAPDGESIAVTTDGGASWTLFDVSAAHAALTQPFWCPHEKVTSLDPWPSVRGQVLQVLGETSPKATTHVHAERIAPDAPMGDNLYELFDASLYACRHAEKDPELRAALIDAFVSPWKGAMASRGGDDSVLPKCLGALARSDPAVLARLSAAAADTSLENADRGRAGSGLYFVDPAHGK